MITNFNVNQILAILSDILLLIASRNLRFSRVMTILVQGSKSETKKIIIHQMIRIATINGCHKIPMTRNLDAMIIHTMTLKKLTIASNSNIGKNLLNHFQIETVHCFLSLARQEIIAASPTGGRSVQPINQINAITRKAMIYPGVEKIPATYVWSRLIIGLADAWN